MENIANIEEGGDSCVWVVNKKKEEDYDGEHVISRTQQRINTVYCNDKEQCIKGQNNNYHISNGRQNDVMLTNKNYKIYQLELRVDVYAFVRHKGERTEPSRFGQNAPLRDYNYDGNPCVATNMYLY